MTLPGYLGSICGYLHAINGRGNHLRQGVRYRLVWPGGAGMGPAGGQTHMLDLRL